MAENFKPRRELRDNKLKRALRAFIVPAFARSYQVVAVRALWDSGAGEELIWGKRLELEAMLEGKKSIVAFFPVLRH